MSLVKATAYEKVNKLDNAATPTDIDFIVANQGGFDKKMTVSQLTNFISPLTGTLADNQLAVGGAIANTIEGSSDLTFDGTDLKVRSIAVARAATNIVEIYTMADFPTPSAGVVTLEANKTYRLMASITTSDRFVIPTGTIVNFESATFNIGLTFFYTGSGTLFTGTDVTAFQIFDVLFSASGGGTFYSISAGVSNFPLITFFKSVAVGFASMGTVTNALYLSHFSSHVNCTAGLTLADPVDITLSDCKYFNTTDLGTTYFTITGSAIVTAAMINVIVTTRATETVFNIANTINATSAIRMVGGNFMGDGVVFDASGLDETSPNLTVFHNANQKNSFTIGSYVVDGNTTATTFAGNGVFTDFDFNALAIAGSTIERFTLNDTTTGELTYNGIEDFDGEATFVVYCTSTGGAVDFQVRIIKNGVALPDVFIPTLDIGSETKAFVVSVPIKLETTDTMRPQVLRVSGTSSITAAEASMVVK